MALCACYLDGEVPPKQLVSHPPTLQSNPGPRPHYSVLRSQYCGMKTMSKLLVKLGRPLKICQNCCALWFRNVVRKGGGLRYFCRAPG